MFYFKYSAQGVRQKVLLLVLWRMRCQSGCGSTLRTNTWQRILQVTSKGSITHSKVMLRYQCTRLCSWLWLCISCSCCLCRVHCACGFHVYIYVYGSTEGHRDLAGRLGMHLVQEAIYWDLEHLRKYGDRASHARDPGGSRPASCSAIRAPAVSVERGSAP